jgi:arsenate reductase
LPEKIHNVLFLCTGNSARSIMAECAMNRWGGEKMLGLSAGSHPKAAPHPLALELLAELGYHTTALRSKSWDEFAGPDAPPLHFVITVCDAARGETCPVWPGGPLAGHWGVDDPAAFTGPADAQRGLFRRVYAELEQRIRRFAALPLGSLDRRELQRAVDAIGNTAPLERRDA